MGDIIVLGSVNMDLVVRGHRLPLPGETVVGGEFQQSLGGKGANQAVAAARLSQHAVTLIGAVGDDAFGADARRQFEKEGMRLNWLTSLSDASTGVAIIMVDERGENCISVASGANQQVTHQMLTNLPDSVFSSASICLASCELPLDAVTYFLERARKAGVQTILNPAPVPRDLAAMQDLLPTVDILTPNEIEVLGLCDPPVDDWSAAAAQIQSRGVEHVVVTRGAQGCLVCSGTDRTEIPAVSVRAVDTTAAGDAFNGALAVRLSAGDDLIASATWANRVAAISVTRSGAQSSLPRTADLAGFFAED